jgi:hypothetical protein
MKLLQYHQSIRNFPHAILRGPREDYPLFTRMSLHVLFINLFIKWANNSPKNKPFIHHFMNQMPLMKRPDSNIHVLGDLRLNKLLVCW